MLLEWKTYRCLTTYPDLDKALKQSDHYTTMAAQSAQQTLKAVGKSITSYNRLFEAYYSGEVKLESPFFKAGRCQQIDSIFINHCSLIE